MAAAMRSNKTLSSSLALGLMTDPENHPLVTAFILVRFIFFIFLDYSFS